MADRKRKRGVGFAPTVCGPGRCRLLVSLLRVQPRLRRVQSRRTRPSYPRPLLRGTRSIKEPEPWTCDACGFENELIHHLLFDLPPFHCKACNADPPEGSVDFGFCYDELALNGFCPIGNMKDQEGPTCMANSLCSGVEMTHRIMRIIREKPLSDGPVVDVDDLLEKYEKRRGARSKRFDLDALSTMIRVLKSDGVRDMEGKKLYKIHDWDLIDEHDFSVISSALADGYPLLTGFQCGKRICDLQPGEVYMPPELGSKDGKTKPVGHIVLLVGAQLEQKEKFFYFLSSWGEEFCQRMSQGDGILGGVGAITADGIDFAPLQLLRFGERCEEVVHHPEYPSL